MSYLQANLLTKSYGDIELFKGIDLNMNADSRMALIARNGAGKTSLLNILAGKDTPDTGTNANRVPHHSWENSCI